MAEIDELLVWQLANELRVMVTELASRPSVRRDYRFVTQVLDSCSGVARNIAEGYGRRRPREFAHFLLIARGSLAECEDQLGEGLIRKHWNADDIRPVRLCCRRIRGAIDGLIRYLRSPRAEQQAEATLRGQQQS